MKMFCELHARIGSYITAWNDAPYCTYEKVVTMLSQDDLFSDLAKETRKHYEKSAISTIKTLQEEEYPLTQAGMCLN